MSVQNQVIFCWFDILLHERTLTILTPRSRRYSGLEDVKMKIFLAIVFSVFILAAQGVRASSEEVLAQDEEIMSMIENSIVGFEETMRNLEQDLDEFQRLTDEFFQIETDRQNKEAKKRLRETKEGWERIQKAMKESEARYRLR